MPEASPVTDDTTPAGSEQGSAFSGALLGGRWLLLGRIGWVTVTLTLVALSILGFSDLYGTYFTYTPSELQQLHQLNFSPALYSVIGILLNTVGFQLVYLLLGLLLFLRRSNDRMALFCAFTLVTFGSAVTFYNFSTGDVVPTLAANPIVHVVALLLFGAGETSLVVFFYLFPSGRFAPRLDPLGRPGSGDLLCSGGLLPEAALQCRGTGDPRDSTLPADGRRGTNLPLSAHFYRPEERQQTKWVVFGFVLVILLLAQEHPAGGSALRLGDR